MPLIDRPFAAKMLQREDRNVDRLARTDIVTYPPGNLMRDTVRLTDFSFSSFQSRMNCEICQMVSSFACYYECIYLTNDSSH
jgi:hypothetical protein